MGEFSTPVWKIVLYCVSLIGVQFAWSLELTLNSSYLGSLCVSSFYNHLIWAAGPISGFVVGPIVGIYSDNNESRFGRRRPFVVLGLLTSLLSMFFFYYSSFLGKLFIHGDEDCHTNPHGFQIVAVPIAAFAFLFMDLSLNTIQGPLRALVSDLVAADQQNLGQSIATLMQAVGAIAGNLTIYLITDPNKKDDVPNMVVIGSIGMATLLLTTLITLLVAREKQYFRPEGVAIQWYTPFFSVGKGVIYMPREMKILCLVQFLSWLAWFTFLPSVSLYMGHVITTDNTGNQKAALGTIYQAAVQLVSSFMLPLLLRVGLPLKILYSSSYVLMGSMLIGLAFLSKGSVTLALVLVGGLGLPFAATNIFPFALTGEYFRDASSQGLNMGVLNWFIVLPQLIDTLWTGEAATPKTFFKGKMPGDSFVFLIGGIFAFLAAFAALFVIVYPQRPSQPQTEEEAKETDMLVNPTYTA